MQIGMDIIDIFMQIKQHTNASGNMINSMTMVLKIDQMKLDIKANIYKNEIIYWFVNISEI